MTRAKMKTDIQEKPSALACVISRFTLPFVAKRKTYQPVYLNGKQLSKGGRESYARWEEIEKIIDAEKITSVADLGCAEGFFVRKSAEKGCFATGVDADVQKLLWAQTTLTLDALDNFGFIKMHMGAENINRVPKSDMVIFLSVLHHVMYEKGEPYALEFMKEVRKITGRVVVFEMGQSNETHYAWAKLLPDMGADPKAWITDFLKRAGFSQVKELRQVGAHKGEVTRTTFAAYV
jgi:cyclopropane fatty-acyl-phospholipid synthase-like methyltransferase